MIQFSQEQLIDLAINIAGYLAAGGFWLVIYSVWQNRRQRATAKSPAAVESRADSIAPGNVPAVAAAAEFVDLRASLPREEPSESEQAVPKSRRDRSEVFALARKMLAKGVSQDMIKKTVPISDGELALLAGH